MCIQIVNALYICGVLCLDGMSTLYTFKETSVKGIYKIEEADYQKYPFVKHLFPSWFIEIINLLKLSVLQCFIFEGRLHTVFNLVK